MRRLIAAAFAVLIAAASASAQNYYDFDDPTIPLAAFDQGRIVSGHSISAHVLGLEYSYEQALGGSWSMVFRAGAPCVLTYAAQTFVTDTYSSAEYSASNTSVNYSFSWGPRPGITIEPRYYTNMERRSFRGKKTANNCADFVALRTILYASGDGGEYDIDGLNLSAIGMYGIRRGSNHWFREYTFGAGFHTKFMFFLPHINFRIGYTF